MKFILNKDVLTIEETRAINSGSISYYEADVEYDDSWKDLTIAAIMTKVGEDTGKSFAVINNKIFVDQTLEGAYSIGFVGYKIGGEVKTYQISTNLIVIDVNKGAGEIVTENEALPTPTEWEIYIAQIEEMMENFSGGGTGGKVDDVLVDGVSVVKDKIANISLYSLEKTLRDILTIIQGGELDKNQVADIEQLIVSYFENKTVEEVET